MIRSHTHARNEFQADKSPIIQEFRENGGKVKGANGSLEGTPVLLLTTTGAKSGQACVSPLNYLLDGDHLFVFATAAGAPTHPAWYHNIVAHPRVTVEIGTEQFEATAIVRESEAGRKIYAKLVEMLPHFGGYASKANRKIPVIELIRRNG